MILKSLMVATCMATSCLGLLGTAHAESEFDIAIEAIIATDAQRYGIPYTDDKLNGSIFINPTYDIYYGSFYLEGVDFGPGNPTKAEYKAAIGATPVFGNLAVDFNLQRRGRVDAPTNAANRWLPYVTGTYTFSDQVSTSLGVGYYAYDNKALAKSFWEIYGAVDLTPVDILTLHGEASYEPNSNYSDVTVNSDYVELIGSATITLPKGFEVYGKVGYEGYIKQTLPSYTWVEAGVNYSFNDHVIVGVKGHANSLNSVDCPAQAFTTCDSSVFATLTLRGKASDVRK